MMLDYLDGHYTEADFDAVEAGEEVRLFVSLCP